MEITEVRIKLTAESDDRLQAFCSITLDDCFVVRDLKIIEGTNGPFVAMPSRKLTAHCHRCGSKNHLRSNYCNQCGIKLTSDRGGRDAEGRAKLYADIAHPINSQCREMLQQRVIAAYRNEQELAKQPGYMSRYDDDFEDSFVGSDFEEAAGAVPPGNAPAKVDRATQIQPSEPALRPPHTPSAPAHLPDASRPGTSDRPMPGFGAGILDD